MNINELPLEILEKILENLNIEERLNVSSVCQRWFFAALRSITTLSSFDLLVARRSYEKCFNRKVEDWHVFHLFPKCRSLDFGFGSGPNLSTAMDAIGTHLGQIEELTLNRCRPPVNYDFKQLGTRLTKLVSFNLECFSNDACNYCDMIRVCPVLTKIKLHSTFITDNWNKAIPKQVTTASFIHCSDGRFERNEGLFSFLFEHVQSLVKLKWTAAYEEGNSKDLLGLDNLRDLTLDLESSVHAAAFEHCKALKTLKVGTLRVEDLKPERHILPLLENLEIQKLDGEEDDLKLFCPNLVDLHIQPNEYYTGYTNAYGSDEDDLFERIRQSLRSRILRSRKPL